MQIKYLIRCIFTTLMLLLIKLNVSASSFSPIVTNFLVSDYGYANSNWAVAQDSMGRVYFGNDAGLIVYDGAHWKLAPLPNNTMIRSIYVDNVNSRVYVGSFEEFGYYKHLDNGELKYVSLKSQTPDFTFNNDEIWNIIECDGVVIFQSFGSLFFYDGESVEGRRCEAGDLPLNLSSCNGELYAQLMGGNFTKYHDNTFTEIVPRKSLGDNSVVATLPHHDGLLLLTDNGGGFICHSDFTIKPWNEEKHSELVKHGINRAIMMPNGTYIVGTLANGIYAYSSNGTLLWSENTDNQLCNNTVLGLCCDMDENIWVALDNGISYINTKTPMYIFKPSSRSVGMIYDVDIYDSQINIVTNQGVFNYRDNKLTSIPDLDEQAWALFRNEDQLLCGHNKGTVELTDDKYKLVSDIRGGLCFREVEIDGEEMLVQGTYTYLNIYRKGSDGRWAFSNSINSFSQMARNIEVDHLGNIWVEHMRKGIFKIRLNSDFTDIDEYTHYKTLREGGDQSCRLFKIKGRIVLTDGSLFYTYDDIHDEVIPYTDMNEQLAGIPRIYKVSKVSNDKYWFLSNRALFLVSCDNLKFRILDKISYSTFGPFSSERRATITHDKKTKSSYLCLENTIIRIPDARIVVDTVVQHKQMWISEFATYDDANNIKRYNIGKRAVLKSKDNRVKIAVSYPSYDNISYGIRYKLEGASHNWTNDLPSMEKEFAQLEHGEYRFVVEAFNNSGVIACAEQVFVVLRPWYSSLLASIIYILALILVVSFIFHNLNLRKIREKDNRIKEQRITHIAELKRQDEEIARLKQEQLEMDLKLKSKEVAEFAMSSIAHKEFLEELREVMVAQRSEGQFTKQNISKLIAMIDRNTAAGEESWSVFQSNFDRIHDNFFRILKDRYPELTAGDLRLCALLRLNLPTKDISRLSGISVRGVDTARYRLRKKLNLPPEASLVDFMISVK